MIISLTDEQIFGPEENYNPNIQRNADNGGNAPNVPFKIKEDENWYSEDEEDVEGGRREGPAPPGGPAQAPPPSSGSSLIIPQNVAHLLQSLRQQPSGGGASAPIPPASSAPTPPINIATMLTAIRQSMAPPNARYVPLCLSLLGSLISDLCPLTFQPKQPAAGSSLAPCGSSQSSK